MIALELERVTKRLGGREALADVSLSFAGRGVLVVRGENGAGKSTLLRLVAGLLQADRGDVRLFGASIDRERVRALSALGYAPDAPELPESLTVRELHALVASLKRVSREPDAALVAELDVAEILNKRLGALSLGQRRRAILLSALVGDPPLLALDEPTNGLDAAGLEMLTALLVGRTTRGFTTVVASHDTAFAERVATEIVTLAEGRIRP